ncbi:hypothetical protein SALBM311S_10332 [Streptomyces alboniger]
MRPFQLSVRTPGDAAPALVALVHGPDHRLAYVNDAYVTAFGTRPTGAPAREAVPELDALGLLPLLDQVLRSGKPRTVKSRKAPDGRSYTFTCTPVAQGDGGGVLVFATDVTDHAEAAERQSQRRENGNRGTLQRSLLPRNWNSPTTCASRPPTSRAAQRPPSAATGTTRSPWAAAAPPS